MNMNPTLGSGDQDLPGAAEPGQDDPAAVGVSACSACSARAVWVQYKSARQQVHNLYIPSHPARPLPHFAHFHNIWRDSFISISTIDISIIYKDKNIFNNHIKMVRLPWF